MIFLFYKKIKIIKDINKTSYMKDTNRNRKKEEKKGFLATSMWDFLSDNEFWGDDYLSAFIYKKTQRLTAALFLVTDLISDEEAIKKQIRDRGVEMLSQVMSLTTGVYLEKGVSVDSVYSIIFEITSLLEVAHISGFVSEMNFAVLLKEYSELKKLISRKRGEGIGERTILGREFFDVFLGGREEGEGAFQKEDSKKTSVSDIKDRETKRQRDTEKDTKRTHFVKTTKEQNVSKTERSAGGRPKSITKSASNNERKNMIMDVLKKKGSAGVKDISRVVVGCSEKTIQRELTSMINEGVVEKRGEKRWSYYVLSGQ